MADALPDGGAGPADAGAVVLTVRYRRGFGVAAVAVAVLMLVLFGLTLDPLDLVLGVLLGAQGLAYLLGTAVVLRERELALRSPIGLTTRRFPVSGPQDLRIEGKVLQHVPQQRRILLLGVSLHREDVARLRAWIGGDLRGSG